MKFTTGQKVVYTFYGQEQTATIESIGPRSGTLFLDNGKWMHPTSCKLVEEAKQL